MFEVANTIITRESAKAQYLRRYFTGDPCQRGHVAERFTANLTCVECDREKQREKRRAYDQGRREEERHRLREWANKNREKVNARARENNAKPERKAYRAAWFQANKERIQSSRDDSAANVASAKRWAQANPDKAREYYRLNARNRRAQKKNSGGRHTVADLAEIFAGQRGLCVYCRADLTKTEKHVDHIVPLAKGGSNGRENLQYLCRPCNQAKSAKHPNDFARERGLLL